MILKQEKKKAILSLSIPVILLAIMYIFEIVEYIFNVKMSFLGVYPLEFKGLAGILLMPFVHGEWSHILANTVPFFILSTALFYFYSDISVRVFLGIWVLSGIWVWFGGRPSWHIGASGVIYGLSSFLFLSGIIRKDSRLAALSLIVIFLYGSLVWGVFPDFFPKEKNVSWEGHLGGAVSGVIMALYYRKSGPQRKLYSWELEPEEEDEDEKEENDDRNEYWRRTIS